MTTIWKFRVDVVDTGVVNMPAGAEVLCVQLQDGVPWVWAKVDDEAPPVARVFHWRGTGHPLRNVGRYIGTVQQLGGALVLHLFEGVRS